MTLLYFLTLFPLVPALGMLLARGDRARDAVGLIGSGIIMAVTVVVAVMFFGTGPQSFEVAPGTSSTLSIIISAIDVILCDVILYNARKFKSTLATVLGIVQLVGSSVFAAMALPAVEVVTATPLYLDYMSVIMVLAVGIVGSLICVYALGYMKDFQAHDEHEAALRGQTAPDRRPQFLALMFLFLSAMFVIVTSDNLEWLFCGWEITTVCSFLMIGYTRTPEAIKNAFTQIILNMLGGIAFLAGLMYLHVNGMPLTISGMIELSGAGTAQSALLVMPVVLLSLAALTKAAQMPFHTWLLGAMVAPTPTSALLHSSTMVKAGVFLIVKLSPLYATYPVTGFMVTSVGAITFLLAALMAISQSNAKRVLAYSTISNLGLISACLGVGAPEAVWAAIFLILFHTVAKSLLFLCVGTAEHHIGSRNIEDMDGMFSRMPHLTRLMMLGIMGMFVAPFGMLVSKWGALVAFAQTGNVLMIMVLAFGSAATFFFWGKWLAKLSGVDPTAQNVEGNVHKSEWTALNTIAALLVLCCVAFPLISSGLVSPYLAMVFGRVPHVIGKDAMYLMVVIVAFIAVVLLTSFRVSNKPHVNVYLSGVGTESYRHFRGSMGHEVKAEKRNWYLEDALGEKRLGPAGSVVCCAIILFALLCCAWIGPERLAMSAPSVLRGKYFEGSGVVGIFIGTVAFALIAPFVGGLIDGLDRKLSARMQGRVGPRLLQPFYDVAKLLRKAPASVNTMDDTYMACALIFTVVGGGIFVSGSNTLLCAFMVTLAAIFVVLASASTQSPFAQVGADRELLQVMSYEPAVLLMSVGLYLATDSFDSIAVTGQAAPIIVYSAPIFLALLAVLTIKLRKSPFDLSYSHHAHQEIVQGIATEMSGGTLAKMTLMHWCETVLFLMWVGMFFVWDNPVSWIVALVVMAATYFVEVLIDNTFARSTWRSCFKLGWGVALVFGLLNLMPILVDVFI